MASTMSAGRWRCEDFSPNYLANMFAGIDNKPAIYRIVQLSTGRFYVGSTVNARNRLKRHFYDLQASVHHSPFLQRAWSKYGKSDFFFEVVEFISDRNWLLFHEQSYINLFQDRSLLFNTCMTAGNCLGVRPSEETKAKLSESRRGRIHSAATRLSISLAKKGRCSESTKKAISTSAELRRVRLSQSQLSSVKILRSQQMSWENIAKQLNVGVKQLRRELRANFSSDFMNDGVSSLARKQTIAKKLEG